MKLPDAIIAATALAYDLVLVSRNEKDFDKIPNLEYINPYNLQ
jgi:predicted nucleic acid-binding protein